MVWSHRYYSSVSNNVVVRNPGSERPGFNGVARWQSTSNICVRLLMERQAKHGKRLRRTCCTWLLARPTRAWAVWSLADTLLAVDEGSAGGPPLPGGAAAIEAQGLRRRRLKDSYALLVTHVLDRDHALHMRQNHFRGWSCRTRSCICRAAVVSRSIVCGSESLTLSGINWTFCRTLAWMTTPSRTSSCASQ